MSTSMRRAIKILNLVSGLGFDKTKPEDREKRSSLVHGLLMTKYDRARAQKEQENVQAQAEVVPADQGASVDPSSGTIRF